MVERKRNNGMKRGREKREEGISHDSTAGGRSYVYTLCARCLGPKVVALSLLDTVRKKRERGNKGFVFASALFWWVVTLSGVVWAFHRSLKALYFLFNIRWIPKRVFDQPSIKKLSQNLLKHCHANLPMLLVKDTKSILCLLSTESTRKSRNRGRITQWFRTRTSDIPVADWDAHAFLVLLW